MENLLTLPIAEHKEKALHKAKVHWISYVRPIIVALMLLPWALLALVTKYFVIAGLLGLIIFRVGILPILRNLSVQISLSRNYLTITTGVFGKKTIDIPLNKLEGITLHQSSFGRMLNYGTLTVTTGQVTTSYKISNPMELRIEIMKLKNY
ncbi:MAG: PH domain-containing protein [Bergeyella sp.]